MHQHSCQALSDSNLLDIVYLGAEDLEKGVFSRSQAVARQLANRSRVLYANVGFCSVFRYLYDRLFRRNVQRGIGLRHIRQNLWSLDCLTPVPFRLNRKFNQLNMWIATPQLRRAINRLRFKNYILWVGSPFATPLVDEFVPSAVCYDYMDDVPEFFQGSTRRRAVELENQLLERSNFVIAASDLLFRKARRFNSNVHLVRNGVTADYYNGKLVICSPELRLFPRPILGYIGYVGPWFDFGLLAKLAKRYPGGSIVVVGGPAVARPPELSNFLNVHFLGWKPHREMPQFLEAFDVCLIPFLINDLTIAVNPIKFYEYCAAGKPTVSTRLPELEPYRDICYLADSSEEFIRAVGQALHEVQNAKCAAELARRRRQLATENSWEARGKEIEAILRTQATH